MTLLKLVSTAVLGSVCVLLGACGGGGGGTAPSTPVTPPTPAPTASFSIGGSVTGLANVSGLTLVNGSETLPIAANTTNFVFASKVPQGGSYGISVGSQPTGATCTANSAIGAVNLTDIQSIKVNCAPVQHSGPSTVSTFAGDDGQTYVDGVGAAARFFNPASIVMDSAGNMYVADVYAVRKVTPSGVVSTFAGGVQPGFVDGAGTSARFETGALAIDGSDNIYVADHGNSAIRKISPSGNVTTLAGNGTQGYADGAGAAARFTFPAGLAVDGVGNVYVADNGNNAIRKITPAGVVSTLAGGGPHGFADGVGAAARFNAPTGLALDSAGNVYIADTYNYAVRKITPLGVASTFAGDPSAAGFLDGVGASARFNLPNAIAVDGLGNMYVSDMYNSAVRKITPDARVSTLAGGSLGYANGSGAVARFGYPEGIIVDAAGNVRVADGYGNRAIRAISPAGVVTTIAGQGPVRGQLDGAGTTARFVFPVGIALGGSGNLYIADQGGNAVRKIAFNGEVSTLAGGGPTGNVDATGAAAQFTSLSRIAADNAGNVYVIDKASLRKISPAGVVTTLQQIANPRGIAVDGVGTLYVTISNSVVTLSPSGVLTLLAGGDSAGMVDGMGAAARFSVPQGVALDAAGNVYVVDGGNHAIRKISPQGLVSTTAVSSLFDFNGPTDVAVDGAGVIYATGSDGRCNSKVSTLVSKVTSDGVVTIIAGPNASGHVDGPGPTAQFFGPMGIVVDGAGNAYVTDACNAAIRKIAP